MRKSRSKAKSTISPKAHADMKAGFPKKMKSGGFVARGCGAVLPNRRKRTKI